MRPSSFDVVGDVIMLSYNDLSSFLYAWLSKEGICGGE